MVVLLVVLGVGVVDIMMALGLEGEEWGEWGEWGWGSGEVGMVEEEGVVVMKEVVVVEVMVLKEAMDTKSRLYNGKKYMLTKKNLPLTMLSEAFFVSSYKLLYAYTHPHFILHNIHVLITRFFSKISFE